ncbi:MAG: hypothetical protein AAGA18_01790 [Verrucomicrobiota bacterium]
MKKLLLILAGVSLLSLSSLKGQDSGPEIDPEGDFFTNFFKPEYTIVFGDGSNQGDRGSDLKASYDVIRYRVDPRYELIFVGEYPQARFASFVVYDDYLATTDYIRDFELKPLKWFYQNHFRSNIQYKEDQLYAGVISFGGGEPNPDTILPGCSLEGYNVRDNFLDASKRNESVSWNHEENLPAWVPPYIGGDNLAGTITFRRFIKGEDNGILPLARPVVIVREVATGQALTQLEAFQKGIVFFNDAYLEPFLPQLEIWTLKWYNEVFQPKKCYWPDPESDIYWTRGTEHVAAGNPDSGYLSAEIPTWIMPPLLSGERFIRLRFKLPVMAKLPTTGEIMTGNEELRYWSLSFQVDPVTLATISDDELILDPDGYVNLIIGLGGTAPAYVTPENFYTFFDFSELEGYENVRAMAIRTILPDVDFCGSAQSVPFKTSEHNPMGGFMGEYVPVVDYPLVADLPEVAEQPLPHPESCGVLPPPFPPPFNCVIETE